jgi:hypothetical protein
MSDSDPPELITNRTLWVVFLSVVVSSGTGPAFQLLGYGHPLISIAGALVGAGLATYEAREVQKRIDQAAVLGTGFAPGFGG